MVSPYGGGIPAGVAAFGAGLSGGNPFTNVFGSVAGSGPQGDDSFDKVVQVLQLENALSSARTRQQQQQAAEAAAARKAAAIERLGAGQDPRTQAAIQLDPGSFAQRQIEQALPGAPAPLTEDQRIDNELARQRFEFERQKFEAGPKPTPLQQDLQAAGLQPGTPAFNEALLDTRLQRRQGEAAADKAKSAVTVQEAKEASKAQIGYRKFAAAVDRHRKNLEKYGAAATGEGSTRVSSSLTALRAAVKDAQSLGTYDEGVARLLEEMVSDPTTLSTNLLRDPLSMIGLAQSGQQMGLAQLDELEQAARANLQASQPQGDDGAAGGLSGMSDQQLLQLLETLPQ